MSSLSEASFALPGSDGNRTLFDTKELSDIEVDVGDNIAPVAAHAVLLLQASPYFAAAMRHNRSRGVSTLVLDRSFSVEVNQQCLQAAYNLPIQVSY